MSAAFDLSEDSFPPAAPQVFSRVFSVPPGAPWEQARAAQLEVQHGSPVPISDLVWRLRRLERWGPGRAGRYAVFSIRSREFTQPFETTVEIEGQEIRVAFGAAAEQMRRAKRLSILLIALAVGGAALTVSLVSALQARGRSEDSLQLLEQSLARKTTLARTVQRQRAQGRELSGAVGQARRVEDVLADLAWASAAKAPDARIDAVHWDHGLLAVEVRGEAPPFAATDRKAERSARPVRPGTWLWGVKSGRPSAVTP